MPYCLVVERKGKSPLVRGPYSSFTAERKKDVLEEKTMLEGGDAEVSIESVSSWNSEKAYQELRERLVDRLGVDKGARNFRHKG